MGAIGASPTPADKQSPGGWARLWHPVCEGKEQIFPRLFSDTAERVGGNIESKRSASPYHHQGSLHFPRKTNCLTDASISELKYKTGRVIFKLRRQLWQLERQLRDDASNLGGVPFQLRQLALFGGVCPTAGATKRRRAQAGPRGSQSSFQCG